MIQDYYTAAAIAAKKTRIWKSSKEDAIQFIVMKLWQADLPEHVSFKKLISVACNKARDFLREQNGRRDNKSQAQETMLLNEHLQSLQHDPSRALENYLDLKHKVKKLPPGAKQLIEEYIVNGKSMKELGAERGVSEGRMSQIFSEIEGVLRGKKDRRKA